MTEQEYRSHPAVSRSQLWLFSDNCPEKVKYLLENPVKPTEAMIFGQALHMFVLQPEIYNANFAAYPKVKKNTKAGKEAFAQHLADCGERIMITTEEQIIIEAMADKIKADSMCQQLLSGEHEKEFFWTDGLTREACKCRADAIVEIDGITYVVDIKTTVNAETEAFEKSGRSLGYHVQAAMYCDGVKTVTGKECEFVVIAIEKEPPYCLNIIHYSKPEMLLGFDKFRECLGKYHYCKANNHWYDHRGKHNVVNEANLPAYLAKEIE